MNPVELAALIHKGPTGRLIDGLAPLTEKERKALSKSVVELRKRCFDGGRPGLAWMISDDPAVQRLKLAVLAVGPWGEAQRIRVMHVALAWNPKSLTQDDLFRVLHDRKPDWLAKWVERELDGGTRDFPDWCFVRRLIRAGLCPRPQSDNYILRMQPFGIGGRGTLKDALLDDPDLLDWEVWKLFEMNPAQGTIIWSADAEQDHGWAAALVSLAAEGKLDRRRLLDASLAGCTRNLEARNTGWFARFHERLEPTEDERHALQPSYLQLLGHRVPGVVGLAQAALACLQSAGRLDVPAYLDAVRPVFNLEPKAQPLAAVNMLGRLVSNASEHGPALAETLLAATAHPAAEVQEKILKLLEQLPLSKEPAIATGLRSRLDQLAPSAQDRARKLLARLSPAEEEATGTEAIDESSLLEAARQVPAPWRELAGIDTLVAALDIGGTLQAIDVDPMRVPRLYPEHELVPIQTLDELLARLTVAVEALNDPMELELLLDGLSRLCAEWPEDMPARVTPLVHRLWEVAPHQLTFVPGMLGLRAPLFQAVVSWCGSAVPAARKGVCDERRDLLGLLKQRVDCLRVRLTRRQAAPLLACPTHRQGWVQATELARRLAWYQEHKLEPSEPDTVQALLRLAPDGRAEVLAAADRLEGRYAAAFRYALGGELTDPMLPVALLITAGRARDPRADLTDLRAKTLVSGPDALEAARYRWDIVQPKPKTKWDDVLPPYVGVTVTPDKLQYATIRDLPSALVHRWGAEEELVSFTGESHGSHGWAASVWPAQLDPFFAAGTHMPPSGFMDAELLRQRAAFLGPLFDPDVPFTEMAQLLVALALIQKEPEVAGLAVDVLIELIRDGRCAGPELGGIYARLLPAGLVKPNRLAERLATAARASLLHGHVCAQVAQAAMADLDDVPRDLHHLLDPLLQWLTASGQGLKVECRPLLEKVTTGKTGTLARRLLQLPNTLRREIYLEALQGRLERSDRWQAAPKS